jgi:hypothetical protein
MKSFLVIFLIIFDLSVSFSQEDSNSNFWNNVSFGGGIGLNFTDGFFSGTLAPQDEDESIYADPWLPFVRFWF